MNTYDSRKKFYDLLSWCFNLVNLCKIDILFFLKSWTHVGILTIIYESNYFTWLWITLSSTIIYEVQFEGFDIITMKFT